MTFPVRRHVPCCIATSATGSVAALATGIVASISLLVASHAASAPRLPMRENPDNALMADWAEKPVLASRILSDMESPAGWSATGAAKISFTQERSKDGTTSLRYELPCPDTPYHQQMSRTRGGYDGTVQYNAMALLKLPEPEDWTPYDRISLWVYAPADSAGMQNGFRLAFTCQDIATSPLVTPHSKQHVHTIIPGQWNQVFWEIGNVPRHKVVSLSLSATSIGHPSGLPAVTRFDIDRIELQRIDMIRREGWKTLPGKIAFCHSGYAPGEPKVAIASNLTDPSFQVIDPQDRVVFSGPVETQPSELGQFQRLDFSAVRAEGTYRLRAGAVITRPFPISASAWRTPIVKALNFFYHQRCGFAVPGVHGVCHQDMQATDGETTKVINGGWHDAGDMCQGNHQTGLSLYAMLELAHQLGERGQDAELLQLTLEEAAWGLEWMMKTRFPGGNRVGFVTMRMYTDGRIGTPDDVVVPTRPAGWVGLMAAANEAYGYTLFKGTQREFAAKCLAAARADWADLVPKLPSGWEERRDGRGSYQPNTLLTASWAAVAAWRLHQATGDASYLERAPEFGRVIMACQQRAFADGIPITGFFYSNPHRQSLVHYNHFSFEESPLVGLAALCEALPNHADWIQWYGAATLHAEYFLKSGAAHTAPYAMLPAGIYKRSEIEQATGFDAFGISRNLKFDETQRAVMLKQLTEGVRLSDEYYLRRFPIQVSPQMHGSTGIQLSEAVALNAATRLRNDPGGARLAARQLEWVLGANPFSQSLMYGEGYEYAPLFSASAGNIVGALPVGVDCLKNDEPYWPSQNYMTTKEVWVVPTGRFIWNMAHAAMPALLQGTVVGNTQEEVVIEGPGEGHLQTLRLAEGQRFSISLPAGRYVVRCGPSRQDLTLLASGRYDLRCDPARWIRLAKPVAKAGSGQNSVRIEMKAEGRGNHTLVLKAFNARARNAEQTVELPAGGRRTVVWNFQVENSATPWVAVVIPNGQHSLRHEITGTAEERMAGLSHSPTH